MNRRKLIRGSVLTGAMFGLAPTARSPGDDPKPLKPNPNNLYATAKNAMVSTAHPCATEAVLEAMKKAESGVTAALRYNSGGAASLTPSTVEAIVNLTAGDTFRLVNAFDGTVNLSAARAGGQLAGTVCASMSVEKLN